MPLDPVRFAALRPWLWHLTAARNLPAIRAEGALVSPALLAPGDPVLARRRRTLVTVDSPGRGPVVLRDQQPLDPRKLTLADGFAFDDLLASLNGRVFFWPGDATGPIAYGRRHFAKYAGTDVALIRVPTAALIGSAEIELSRVNSGAAGRYPGQSHRGPDTFVPSARWKATPGAVVEVTVRGRVALPPGTETGTAEAGRFAPL